MRRKPMLINLCDKPLQTRPALCSHRRTPPGDGFSRLCACVLIVAVTLACFWVYDRIAHRESAYGPSSLRAHALEFRSDRPSTPAAVAPDMNSDAVRHANADVPAQMQRTEQKPELNAEQKPAPKKTKYAAAPLRKKKANVIARRPLNPWMQAYAWGPRTFQMPFRSY